MKSDSNKTEYDDELYYRAIIASLKCLMNPPVEGDFKVVESGKKVVICTEKMTLVKTAAAGTITTVEEKNGDFYITLIHRNNIKTRYGPLKKPEFKKSGIELKQGTGLGYSKEFAFQIEVIPTAIIT